MIRSFKHRGLKRLYERGDGAGFVPTCWKQLNESSPFSTQQPQRKVWIPRAIASIRSKAT
jgi:hypothetical protein